MLSGARANIAVKIFGPDLAVLRDVAREVEAAARAVPGAVDVAVEAQANIPTVRVHFDRDAPARHGQPAGAAAEAMRTAFVGREVGQVFEGQVAFPLVVRYPAEVQRDLDAIRRTRIDTPAGARVPLAAVASIREDRGPATRNGIMMISHIRHLLEVEGEASYRRAVVRGARERLVPILMTALAAGLALVPLAFAGARPGAELEAPMAVVIVCGLASATALNMIVVPIAYHRFGRLRRSPGV